MTAAGSLPAATAIKRTAPNRLIAFPLSGAAIMRGRPGKQSAQNIALVLFPDIHAQNFAKLGVHAFGQIRADHQPVSGHLIENLPNMMGHQARHLEKDVWTEQRSEYRLVNKDTAAAMREHDPESRELSGRHHA